MMPPVKYRPPGAVTEYAVAANALGNAAFIRRGNEDFINGCLEARPRMADSFMDDIFFDLVWYQNISWSLAVEAEVDLFQFLGSKVQ